jgi:hypothetical protein
MNVVFSAFKGIDQVVRSINASEAASRASCAYAGCRGQRRLLQRRLFQQLLPIVRMSKQARGGHLRLRDRP